MADRDWYYHHVMPKWRGAARRIERGDDAARVGDLAVKALAKDVRAAGGVAGLEAFVQIVCDAASGLTPRMAFYKLRQESLKAGGQGLTRIAADAAQQVIADIEHGLVCDDLGHEARRRFVERALDSRLFAPSRPRTVGTRFANFGDAHNWEHKCLDAVSERLDRFAKSLARHPDGTGLRAPVRTIRRESTMALINQPVG